MPVWMIHQRQTHKIVRTMYAILWTPRQPQLDHQKEIEVSENPGSSRHCGVCWFQEADLGLKHGRAVSKTEKVLAGKATNCANHTNCTNH